MSALSDASAGPLDIAVIGSGISGMAAAWLLSARHRVTLYERDKRAGGHSHTVEVPQGAGSVAVDTGFVVYNERTYPNLTALFGRLKVPTQASTMSFSASLDDGRLEYSGSSLATLFAQPLNLVRPRFWAMLRDLLRFYRTAPSALAACEAGELTLGGFLEEGGYSRAFIEDHLLPMAAAIWSASVAQMRDYPAAALIRFCDNHGLLRLRGRPQWRSITGGSREYVRRLTAPYAARLCLERSVHAVRRQEGHVLLADREGAVQRFDHIVIATHADQALALLSDPDTVETATLGAFRYQRNEAVLHRDAALMPRRRRVWSSWNYLGRSSGGGRELSVTYWLNRLHALSSSSPLFVTLNPGQAPRTGTILDRFRYEHPLYDIAALRAQRALWSLQGRRNTWFCGAYFGAGFHEDGLQAGLAVAEALGGVKRPWHVDDESGRIHVGATPARLFGASTSAAEAQ